MTLRIALAAAACTGLSLMVAYADGMPEPDDRKFNPVKSVPGVPAPGVKPPPPIRESKPTPPPPSEPDDVVDANKPPVSPPPPPAASPPPPPPATTTPPPPPASTTPPTTTPPPSPPPGPATSLRKPIYEVVSVEVQLGERQPPFVTVMVKGTARAGGWRNIALEPLKTLAAEVGQRSFTLVGDPPTGIITQALTPVSVTIRLDPLPEDVKTIRVLGETNEVSQKFR